MRSWTMLTCEYPPACGGVGDYSAQLAAALARAGDEVTVFCPPLAAPPVKQSGVEVVVLEDVYGRSSRQEIDLRLRGRQSTVLVQYVPTAFGMGGANVPFCRWLLGRSRRYRADVRVMFHEPYFEFGWAPAHQTPLSLVQRLMARMLLQVGTHTYLSTDSWRSYLEPYARGDAHDRFVTLPVPSAIPRCTEAPEVQTRRRDFTESAANDLLVGHFGTYGTHVAPMLQPALLSLLANDERLSAVCIGAGSDAFVSELTSRSPALNGRLEATGRVPAPDAARTLAACDLLLQPYPDGVTTRRTSVMAGLNNGRPVLTTSGHLTEGVWAETGAVKLTPAGDGEAFLSAARTLLADRESRSTLAARGLKAYDERFALEHTLDALRSLEVVE
jgi:glycosyltransferase involved in cell wall biosynthesis